MEKKGRKKCTLKHNISLEISPPEAILPICSGDLPLLAENNKETLSIPLY